MEHVDAILVLGRAVLAPKSHDLIKEIERYRGVLDEDVITAFDLYAQGNLEAAANAFDALYKRVRPFVDQEVLADVFRGLAALCERLVKYDVDSAIRWAMESEDPIVWQFDHGLNNSDYWYCRVTARFLKVYGAAYQCLSAKKGVGANPS